MNNFYTVDGRHLSGGDALEEDSGLSGSHGDRIITLTSPETESSGVSLVDDVILASDWGVFNLLP